MSLEDDDSTEAIIERYIDSREAAEGKPAPVVQRSLDYVDAWWEGHRHTLTPEAIARLHELTAPNEDE